MAAASAAGRCGGQDCDFLLHPELLSRDFLLLSLEQKNIVVKDAVNDKEQLTEIFVQHAMPLPQRQLPKSRWGKLMESRRGVRNLGELHNKCAENIRKRPLIVFDGASTSTSIKVKKTENGDAAQRLHQSCTEKSSILVKSGAVPTSPVSHHNSSIACKETKLSTGNHEYLTTGPGSYTATVKVNAQSPISGSIIKIKRAAPKEDSDVTNDGKPTEAKKKIQHVTWP
ncbi:ashwin [Eleutherodactylus coqui]|uniref:Ashwin n=1 Tax=Eleutherodactylus coqui TaxID=57060 RepID=A0A8J6BHK7_ELECQ|nr:hypothetical protein GDO78_021497 [Eleutherodactylus coqui]